MGKETFPVIEDDKMNMKVVRTLIKIDLIRKDVNLRMLLENSLAMIKDEVVKKGIHLSMDTDNAPENIIGDERKLKQIIHNLLSNAVKFTPDSGEVSINIRTVDCIVRHGRRREDMDMYIVEKIIDGSEVVDTNMKKGIDFSVSDTGIGIRSEYLERIFSLFARVKSPSSRMSQGTGLGLFLTKRLVESHGGIIWAESEGEGKGSTFHFVIAT